MNEQKRNILGVAFFLLFVSLIYGFYRGYRSLFHSFDTGLYLQLAHNFFSNLSLESSLVGEKNFLSHHFQPTFIVFTPIIYLFPYTYTLSILAFMCIAISTYFIVKNIKFTHTYQVLLLFPFILSPAAVGRVWANFCPDIFPVSLFIMYLS